MAYLTKPPPERPILLLDEARMRALAREAIGTESYSLEMRIKAFIAAAEILLYETGGGYHMPLRETVRTQRIKQFRALLDELEEWG